MFSPNMGGLCFGSKCSKLTKSATVQKLKHYYFDGSWGGVPASSVGSGRKFFLEVHHAMKQILIGAMAVI